MLEPRSLLAAMKRLPKPGAASSAYAKKSCNTARPNRELIDDIDADDLHREFHDRVALSSAHEIAHRPGHQTRTGCLSRHAASRSRCAAGAHGGVCGGARASDCGCRGRAVDADPGEG